MNLTTTNTAEYKVIDLRKEYPGFVGDVSFAVITRLSAEVLETKYGRLLAPFKPYVLISVEHEDAIKEFNRNEDKFHKRKCMHETLWGYEDDTTESYFDAFWYDDDLADNVIKLEDAARLRIAMNELSSKQRQRVKMYYFAGFTIPEIADIEGVNLSAVQKSLVSALKKLKKILEEDEEN